MRLKNTFVLTAISAGILGGCATPSAFEGATALRKEATITAEQRQAAPAVLAAPSRVVETPGAYIPVTARKVSENAWLRAQRVDLTVGNGALPLNEVLRILSRQGLTITSELPLDRYAYGGYSLKDIDAETALKTVLTTVGLDYQADPVRRIVTIQPLSTRTWYLNIGHRRSTYASGTASGGSGSGSAMGGSALPGSGSGGGSGGGTTTQSTGTSTISSADDFWGSLKTELDSRMKVMLPEPPKVTTPAAPTQMQAMTLPPMIPPLGAPATGGAAGALPQQAPVQGGQSKVAAAAQPTPAVTGAQLSAALASQSLTNLIPQQQKMTVSNEGLNFSSKTVGSYSLNPETGAITVQAPHWVLSELDSYFKRVQEMYNTDIVFQGELVMLTTDASRSEGLDVSAFARFAGQHYGLAFANNALGGVTLSFPNSNWIPSLSAGSNALSGPVAGFVSPDGLALFNAYLTNLGRVSMLQKPVLTTTSGVPADFRRTVTRFFNSVSQQTAGGGSGSAAVGTQNTLIAQDFGTILRVNPRIDVATGLIRAQIELVQTTQAGTQNISQSLSTGNSVQQVTTPLPIVSKILYSGEALLRDGDLIVMGGQTEDNETSNRDGITDLMDHPTVGGLFGTSKRTADRNVFYFALRVNVNKR